MPKFVKEFEQSEVQVKMEVVVGPGCISLVARNANGSSIHLGTFYSDGGFKPGQNYAQTFEAFGLKHTPLSNGFSVLQGFSPLN